MVKWKISEIAETIRVQLLTESEKIENTQNKLSRSLNSLLIETGDLTESALGKIETPEGRNRGIQGELRELANGEKYWIPLYTDAGYKYVIGLFLRNRDRLISKSAKKPKPATTLDAFRYSRKTRCEILEKYGKQYQVILLEGPNSYWVYDEDAFLIGEKLNLNVTETKRGHILTYNKELHTQILILLNLHKINYIVVHQNSEEPSTASAPSVGIQKPVRGNRDAKKGTVYDGAVFELEDQNGGVDSYIIHAENEYSEIMQVTHSDGTTELIGIPSQFFDGHIRLSPDSALAQSVRGAKVGEVRLCNGEKYTVKSVS